MIEILVWLLVFFAVFLFTTVFAAGVYLLVWAYFFVGDRVRK